MEDAFVTNSLSKRIQGGDNQKHQKAKQLQNMARFLPIVRY